MTVIHTGASIVTAAEATKILKRFVDQEHSILAPDQRISESSARAAGRYLAEGIARKISNGEISPYKGAKAIVTDVLSHIDLDEYSSFVGLEAEFSDFQDSVRKDYYGEEYCEKIRRSLSKRIRETADEVTRRDV